MKVRLHAGWLTGLLLFSWISLLAQQREQIAFVDDVYVIDARIRSSTGVLDNLKTGFRNATLFMNADGTLEIEVYRRGSPIPKVISVTPLMLEEIVSAVENYLEKDENRLLLSEEFKSKKKEETNLLLTKIGLYGSSFIHSARQGLGFSFELAERHEFEEGYYLGGRTLLGKIFPYIFSSASLAGTYLIFKDKKVTAAEVNMHFFNSYAGYYKGEYINHLFLERRRTAGIYQPGGHLVQYGFGMAEGWLSLWIARKYKFSYEQSMAWITGNVWGTALGAYISSGIYEKNREILHDNPYFLRSLRFGNGLIALGTSSLGILSMMQIQKKYPKTAGDYRVINTSAYLGVIIAESRREEWRGGLAGMGDAIGTTAMVATSLAIGHILTYNTNFTSLEGSVIAFTTIGTSLMTYALKNIFRRSSIDTPTPQDFRALKHGALVGWGLSYFGILVSRSADSSLGSNFKRLPVKVDFNPLAIGFLQADPNRQAMALRMNMDVSLIRVGYSF